MLTLLKFSAGVALLLFGMQFMKAGLENVAQRRMRNTLQALTRTPLTGALAGTVITALVQSSTAVTVITISLVNASIINFYQAVGIVLGTNIGTCVTAQLISFRLEDLALPAIGLGAIIMTWSRRKGWRYLGQSIIGFGVVFLGIATMSQALTPLKDSPVFIRILATMSISPILGVLVGTLFTALIHSSSTTTGVVIALAHQGMIGLPAAIAVIFGSNIGTCITGVIASIGSSVNAKRVAVSHVMLNVIGVLLFLPFLTPFSDLITRTDPALARQVANAHTIFNLISSAAVLPFARQFAGLIVKIVPES